MTRDYAEACGYLKAMSISQFFSTREGLAADLQEIRTREDALGSALELEKTTLGYYVAMRDVIGTNEVLEAIIKAEKSHLQAVVRYLVTGGKWRGLGDGFCAR